VEHLHQEFVAITEVPVEAAFADAKVTREDFDTDRFDTVVRQPSNAGAYPVVWMKW